MLFSDCRCCDQSSVSASEIRREVPFHGRRLKRVASVTVQFMGSCAEYKSELQCNERGVPRFRYDSASSDSELPHCVQNLKNSLISEGVAERMLQKIPYDTNTRKWRNPEVLSFLMKNYNCSCTLRSLLNWT